MNEKKQYQNENQKFTDFEEADEKITVCGSSLDPDFGGDDYAGEEEADED